MDRRTFIAAAALLMTGGRATASVGIPASPALLAAFSSVYGIQEGRGPLLHVLFTPWCHVSPEFYRESRPFLDRLTLNWIPFSGGQPEGSEALERLLRRPGPASLPGVFTKVRAGSSNVSTPLADQQDAAVQSVIAPVLIRDTGLSLVSPTMVYAIGERIRVVRGGIRKSELEKIAAAVR